MPRTKWAVSKDDFIAGPDSSYEDSESEEELQEVGPTGKGKGKRTKE